jgi:predicted lipoprotein with Yx(FWY)xxD motif
MASLATALTSVGVVFTDKLLYSLAHRMANNAKLEKGGMQVMVKEDKGTMEACKAMCSRGEWPPLMVTHDSRHRWYVFALS